MDEAAEAMLEELLAGAALADAIDAEDAGLITHDTYLDALSRAVNAGEIAMLYVEENGDYY